MGIMLYLGIILIVLLIVFIINKFDKDKTTEKVINSIGKEI